MYDELIGWVRSFAASENTTVDEAEKLHAVIAAITDLQAQLAQERATSLAMAALLEEMRREMNGLGERGDHVS